MPRIHDTAIIGKNVTIGRNSSVGPYSNIESNVLIGEDCVIASCCKICSGVKMGNGNRVFHGAVLGENPQKMGFDERIQSGVQIGNRNVFREYATVHRSMYEGENTRVGDGNLIMVTGHVAHDCILKNRVVICNGVLLAGHITVGDGSFISGNAAIHQFCNIGDYVMIGGLTRVTQDCPHYSLVVGADGGHVISTNSVGLRRAGFSREDRDAIKEAFKILFWSHLPLREIKARLRENTSQYVQKLADFLENSSRGICSGRKRKTNR